MNITCPHCDLNGKISEDKVRASGGKIKCPRCKKTFSPDTIVPLKQEVQSIIPEEIRPEVNDDGMKFLEDDEIGYDEGKEVEVVGAEVVDILEDEPLELVEVLEDDVIKENKKKLKEKKKKEIKLKLKKDKKPKGMGADLDLGSDEVNRDVKGRLGLGMNSRPKVIGLLLILFFIIVTYALFSGWGNLYQSFVDEKEFLDDSEVLLGKYRELKTLLIEDVPDPIYIIKVIEMAYPYKMYIEKYGIVTEKEAKDDDKYSIISEEEAKRIIKISSRSKQKKRYYDPYYCSLVITGKLFLTTKELLVRRLKAGDYFNVEWGEALPIKTRGEYLRKVSTGLFACLDLMDDNVEYSILMFEMNEGYSFPRVMVDRGLRVVRKNDKTKYRSFYSKSLRNHHRKKIKKIDKTLPIIKETFDEIEMLLSKVK